MIWQIIIDFLKLLYDKNKLNKKTKQKRITVFISYCLSL